MVGEQTRDVIGYLREEKSEEQRSHKRREVEEQAEVKRRVGDE